MSTVETGVNPIPAPSSNGWEIKVPFQIDPCTGGVAFLSNDLDIINQHLITIVETMWWERLMLPGYGGNAPAHVFDIETPIAAAFLQSDLTKAIQAFEPSITLKGVIVSPSPVQQGVTDVTISYTYAPYSDLNQVTIAVGGAVTQVVSP